MIFKDFFKKIKDSEHIVNYFYSFLYQNLEIKLDKSYQINYMNDKYIFYSSGSEIKIIPNDGKYEFIIKNPFKN